MSILKKMYFSFKPFYRHYFYNSKISPVILDQKVSISLTGRFVYYRIPKAANSTIFNSIYEKVSGHRVATMNELSHLKGSYFCRLRDIRKKDMPAVSEFFHFTFVRHPVNRFLSCYRDKIEGGEKSYYVNKWLGREAGQHVTMAQFIDYLEQGGLYTNAHWAPQADLVPSDIDNLDFIGKVENIENDWALLTEKLDVDWPLAFFAPHSTSRNDTSGKETQRSKPALDNSTLRRVEHLYRQDFTLFGY